MYRYKVIDIHPEDSKSSRIYHGQVLDTKLPADIEDWPIESVYSGYSRGYIGDDYFVAIKVEDITEHEVEPDPWIPVSERMPENPMQEVLVTHVDENGKRRSMFVSCEIRFDVNEKEFVADCGRGDVPITHWMPLPEPPQK